MASLQWSFLFQILPDSSRSSGKAFSFSLGDAAFRLIAQALRRHLRAQGIRYAPCIGFGGTLRPVIELLTLVLSSFLAPGWRWWHAGSRFDTWLSREWSGMLHHLPAGPRLEVLGVCPVVSRFVGCCEVRCTVNWNWLRRCRRLLSLYFLSVSKALLAKVSRRNQARPPATH